MYQILSKSFYCHLSFDYLMLSSFGKHSWWIQFLWRDKLSNKNCFEFAGHFDWEDKNFHHASFPPAIQPEDDIICIMISGVRSFQKRIYTQEWKWSISSSKVMKLIAHNLVMISYPLLQSIIRVDFSVVLEGGIRKKNRQTLLVGLASFKWTNFQKMSFAWCHWMCQSIISK